jgi:hypothetical protein
MNHIKTYSEYITEELRKIISNQSGSGMTKEIDWIYTDPDNPRSPSSSVLLRNQLRDKEYADMIDTLSDDKFDKSKLRKNSQEDKFAVTLNNLKFLKDKQSELGKLYCEYCNRGPLRIYDINLKGLKDLNKLGKEKWRLNTKFDKNDGATVDHKQPKSKGGDKFDYNNLAVCCYYCNNEKKDMSWNDWQHFLKQRH